MTFLLQLLFSGVVLGLVYALAALGFVLIYKLLDADDEELTRTGKVRRG